MTSTYTFEHQNVLGIKYGYAALGKPKMFTHIYYVDGLLIDTGQLRMRKQILKTTESLDVGKIFITHYHEDHTGNIHDLRRIHRCKVYATDATCQIMKNPPKISLAQKMVWGNREPCSDLIPLAESIKSKNLRFQIIPIPGHASDMVALYQPEKKWLFSADLFLNTYISYYLSEESMIQQIMSIRNILKLDFDVMFCAHNPQLTNAKGQLTKKLHFLESFFDNVSSLYHKGYAELEIFRHMKLRENLLIKILSGGMLSKLNMVRSVISDINSQGHPPTTQEDVR